MKGIFGKLKGKGQRHQACPSCGRTIDLTRDRCWLGDGGWYCNDCGRQMRDPIRARKAGRARVYQTRDLARYEQQVMEKGESE